MKVDVKWARANIFLQFDRRYRHQMLIVGRIAVYGQTSLKPGPPTHVENLKPLAECILYTPPVRINLRRPTDNRNMLGIPFEAKPSMFGVTSECGVWLVFTTVPCSRFSSQLSKISDLFCDLTLLVRRKQLLFQVQPTRKIPIKLKINNFDIYLGVSWRIGTPLH